MSEKDLYDSGDDDGQKPATDQYFGFETTIARSLYVNYGVPGYKALIEVYAENPIEFVNGNRIKKENVNALFKAIRMIIVHLMETCLFLRFK